MVGRMTFFGKWHGGKGGSRSRFAHCLPMAIAELFPQATIAPSCSKISEESAVELILQL
jgi:hypothetical protein